MADPQYARMITDSFVKYDPFISVPPCGIGLRIADFMFWVMITEGFDIYGHKRRTFLNILRIF